MDARWFEKRHEQMWDEVPSLRTANRHLDLELRALRPQTYRDGIRIGQLEAIVRTLREEMRKITGGSQSKPGAEAWSILASVVRKRLCVTAFVRSASMSPKRCSPIRSPRTWLANCWTADTRRRSRIHHVRWLSGT